MSKIDLNTSIADYGFSQINANFQKIEDEFNQKVLYRDNPVGEPNTIENTVDANNQDIINVKDLYVDNELFIQGNTIQEAIDAAAGGIGASAAASAAQSAISASQSSASASASASSASNAANSYDQFDDRYLGAKATPPTLDNDGNPLLIGALYWDTVLSPGGSYPASDITFSPTGNVGSTTVQAAIAEVDAEKAKLNGDAAQAFSASTFTGNLTGNVTGATTGAHNGTVGATTPNTGSFTTIAASSTITPSQTAGIVGTTTNNNANAGSIGEYLTATGGGTSLTNNTQVTIASLSLTAGDWDVEGVGQFTLGAGATMTAVAVGISTTNNALSTFDRNNTQSGFSTTNSFGSLAYPTPVTRLSLASTLTVYCVGIATFSGGTNTGTGFIRARRVR